MRRSVLGLLLLALTLPVGGQPPAKPPVAEPPAPVGFHRVIIGKHTFTLPKGFTIELVAESPQVDRPVTAAFDDKGRLYVADSSGSNAKPADQLKNPTHRVVMLESTRKDGKFDKSRVFADKLSFLQGTMWHDGSLYVATPPTIQKLTDTDGDGAADKREVWFDGGVLTGCANDVHGPYPGTDGRIYFTKGAFAKQELTLGNGKKFTTRAAHIYSAKPDGSGIRVEMTGGMDNPVDVAFNSSGEMFFTTTFFQHPANGKRDGIVHATYGAVYGKDHDPIHEHIRTRPELSEPMTHLGPAAPAGLHCYRSIHFGEEYQDNLFAANFNLSKVTRHVLKEKSSTYETVDSDFVTSDNRDFHPTDVIEDDDGGLLIVDTGGWYKLCCPSSVMEKNDVLGAIYRVRLDHQKPGGRAATKPVDWKKCSTDALVYSYLRDRAYDLRHTNWTPFAELASRGKEAVETMAELLDDPNADSEDTWHVLLAVAVQIDSPESRELVRKVHQRFAQGGRLSEDKTIHVRLIASHALGLMRNKQAVPTLLRQLTFKDLHFRRVAAEGLGRIADPKAVPEILDILADEQNDSTLDTVLTRSLIDIGDAKATREGLKHKSDRVKRAALAALEQIPGSKLAAADVVPHLGSKNVDLDGTAWWVAGRHPEWGDELVGYFREQLERGKEGDHVILRMVRFASREPVQKLMAEFLLKGESLLEMSFAMSLTRLDHLPDCWEEPLVTVMADRPSGGILATPIFRQLKVPADKYRDLIEQARRRMEKAGKEWDEYERVCIIASSPVGALEADKGTFELMVRNLKVDGHNGTLACDAVARARLTPKQLERVAAALPDAGPLHVADVIAVFAKSTEEEVGLALVKALSEPKVRAAIRTEQVKPILDKYPKAVQTEADKLYKLLASDRAEMTTKLDTLLKDTQPGDVRKGQAVFNSAKAACTACHKVAYVGGLIGPDLTKIGSIRSEKDLLEAIVFPSASFVRSYEPVKVETKDGKSFNGLLKGDRPDEVVLTVSATEEVRIARKEIDEMKPGVVSVMPAGFAWMVTSSLPSFPPASLLSSLLACRRPSVTSWRLVASASPSSAARRLVSRCRRT